MAQIHKILGRSENTLNPGSKWSSLVTINGTPKEEGYHHYKYKSGNLDPTYFLLWFWAIPDWYSTVRALKCLVRNLA